MKKYIILISTVLIFSFLLSISCKEDNDPENADTLFYNLKSDNDFNAGLNAYNQVFELVLIDVDKQENLKNVSTDCPSISYTQGLTYPKTLTLDFGTGCDYNGHTIKGSLSATLSDRIRNQGTTISISFTNFEIDTIKLGGTVSLSVIEANVMNGATLKLNATITNGTLTLPSTSISLSGTLDILWEMKTLNVYTDDLIDFTALNLTGTNTENVSFTATLVETMIYNVSCKETTDGAVKVETANISFPSTINFGDGTCDGKAMVTTTISITIGNKTYEEDYSYEINLR